MNRIHPVGSSATTHGGDAGLAKLFAAVSSGDASHKREAMGMFSCENKLFLLGPSLWMFEMDGTVIFSRVDRRPGSGVFGDGKMGGWVDAGGGAGWHHGCVVVCSRGEKR